MKRIMQRSYAVLILALAFFIGISFVTYKIVANSSKWVQSSSNPYLPVDKPLIEAADILDRNGVVLAHTDSDGSRTYHSDEGVRRALLHVLGDETMNISTAVQSMLRADLSGYSYSLGMGLPDSIKGDRSVTLTVDSAACKAAYEAMGGYKGACIVYNYKTGEILCSVSNPSYDPADPPEITPENLSIYDGVYLDNVLSSSYTPGSTFKIITAACAIENIPDIDDRTFTCEGSFEVLGKPITCMDEHGGITFEEAFDVSCNCVFAQLAIELGDEKMKKTAEELGFNYTGYTVSGIPLAPSHYDAVGAGDNYLGWSGIGQYTDLANPAHMAMICSAVANGGTATSPYIIENNGSLLGARYKKASDVDMIPAATAERLKALMRSAGESYRYYADIDVAGLDYCAKTGTAEIEGADTARTNSWFVGFIEDPAHPYAFAVIREMDEGDFGSSSAVVVDAAISALLNR